MRIVHITRRRILLAAAALAAAAGLSLALAGCFSRGAPPEEPAAAIPGGTDEQRTAFLESFGWQVDAAPLETLDLRLPESFADRWADYAALQTGQGLPFADYAGQTVRRCTYRVHNYPAVPKGVQANVYVCDGVIIGGDVVITGEGGRQTGLEFPAGRS